MKIAIWAALLAATLCLAPSDASAQQRRNMRASVAQFDALMTEVDDAIDGGNYALAEDLARQRLSLVDWVPERKRGSAYAKLAQVLRMRGKLADAEAMVRQGLATAEQARGPNSEQMVRSLLVLGELTTMLSRYADARASFEDALARASKPDTTANDNDHARAYEGLARLEMILGRYPEAENLLAKAQDATDRKRGQAQRLAAELDLAQGRYEAVEKRTRNPTRGAVKGGTTERIPAVEWFLLRGLALTRLKRLDSAEEAYRSALGAAEAALGEDHPLTARALGGLAQIAERRGRLAEAEDYLRRATSVREAGASEVQAKLEWAFGRVLDKRGNLAGALEHYQRAAEIVDRVFAQTQGVDEATRQSYASGFTPMYYELLEVLLRLHAAQPAAGFDRQALAVVSRTQSRVFSEMLRRADAGKLADDPAFKALRARQSGLQASVLQLRRARVAAGADDAERAGEEESMRPAAQRSAQADDPFIRARMSAARARVGQDLGAAERDLGSVESQLWDKFPRYMEVTQPRPVTAELLQARILKPGETLVTYFLLPARTLAFVVTRERFRLFELPQGRKEIAALVGAARVLPEHGSIENLAHLDPGVLHKLYLALFAPIAAELGDAGHLLVVGDGPVHTLPLEMLVTRWGEAEQRAFAAARAQGGTLLQEYATLDYLGAKVRFSYLPSLSALSSMRLYRKAAVRHDRELVSFADPVFEARGAAAHTLDIPRLPETADEARLIGAALGGRSDIYLRDKAQEHTAKTINLKTTRYLHFATHGLLGGEYSEVRAATAQPLELAWDSAGPVADAGQPALVLSLSGDLQGEDGLLTMSEIVETMDLNARLVVLSACNTAGESADATSGEGFAGLTRAFMYAGAQALVVSHWSVESESTRDLMVDFFKALRGGADASRALPEAAARVRTGLPLHGRISRAHPYFWAPFVYVGD